MPIRINGQTYYRTAETCARTGISRATLFRWLKVGICGEPEHRDRRGWRLFTEDEVNRLKEEANRISKAIKFENQSEWVTLNGHYFEMRNENNKE